MSNKLDNAVNAITNYAFDHGWKVAAVAATAMAGVAITEIVAQRDLGHIERQGIERSIEEVARAHGLSTVGEVQHHPWRASVSPKYPKFESDEVVGTAKVAGDLASSTLVIRRVLTTRDSEQFCVVADLKDRKTFFPGRTKSGYSVACIGIKPANG
jgi:hypothetical protein